jgi:hypothetical protein
MADDVTKWVWVGVVPLEYVQSMTISEGYRIEKIAGSRFSQAISPNTKTIAIEAMLVGPERLLLKKFLEALALSSRALVATTSFALRFVGIPVISRLTISLDMQITDLKFVQNTQNREALNVSISLTHVPRTNVATILGEAADLALAVGTAFVSTGPPPNPIARAPGP